MGYPTGSFSDDRAGVLVVKLTATFTANTYHDAGFPNTGNDGTSNISIRGYAGPSGSPNYTNVVDKYNLESTIELDYPGGSVAWPVGVEEVAHKNPGGIYAYSMTDIELSCTLRMR